MLNSNFNKPIDGCTIAGPLSVKFSDIYRNEAKQEVVKPTNLRFSKRFVDDITNKREKNQTDLLIENFFNHHPNIKYITEKMAQKFLSDKINYDNQIQTKVHRNDGKLLVNWT